MAIEATDLIRTQHRLIAAHDSTRVSLHLIIISNTTQISQVLNENLPEITVIIIVESLFAITSVSRARFA